MHPCDKAESPCKNEGVCEKNGDEFVCKCSDDWTGGTCEIKGENKFMITKKKRDIVIPESFNYNFTKVHHYIKVLKNGSLTS